MNTNNFSEAEPSSSQGWLALSPLLVFLGLYLASSLLAKDFYSVPITVLFLISALYSILITKGDISSKIGIFSRGAGDEKILLMIWIFIMAGAFASVAKAIGSVEATVNLTLAILPGKLILAGLFLASCFLSMSVGTSVGTIVALMPIASGLAGQTGMSLPLIAALITGGAFFGDNLSFISDTTIAATTTQGCPMSDKFKANIWIAGPAALIATVIYLAIGMHSGPVGAAGEIELVKLLPYLSVIILAACGMNVLLVLSIGIVLCLCIGLFSGFRLPEMLGAAGNGILGMGELIVVTLLAGGMLEIIRHNKGIDFIINSLKSRIKGKRGAEFCIGGLVALSNLCTANNTIAILTTGKMAKGISNEYGISPRKTASILDVFSCLVQSVIPYGAQLLMASNLSGVAATEIIPWLFYPAALLLVTSASILFDFPK